MSDFHMEYVYAINTIFEKFFSATYRQSNAKNRARLLPYISNIHRRWFYAALIKDTLLTPANMIESVNRAHGKHPSTAPTVCARSESRFNGMTASFFEYTADNHPVTDDLTYFIRSLDVDIELDENDGVFLHQALTFTPRLSQCDPHYVSYLMNVAIDMGLVVKIPSIYVNRAQLARDVDDRLSIPPEALFAEIVEATIKMSARILTGFIQLPEPLFDEGFIRALLTEPMHTDEIFRQVYATLGVSLDDLIGPNGSPFSDNLSESFLSGTYIMGVLLDKYFFTPFGHYLKLIRPTYAIPFNFDSEMRDFTETGFDDEDLENAFFSPCSQYFFTDLGLSHFGITATPHNYLNLQERMPFSMLQEQLFTKKSPTEAIQAQNEQLAPPIGLVYAIKIKSDADPGQWLNMDVAAEMTLHQLYREIALFFRLDDNDEYSFFHDSTENPFAEYSSIKKSSRTTRKSKPEHAKKTVDATLDSLDFDHKRHMVLTAYNQFDQLPHTSTLRFSLEIYEKKPRKSMLAYPLITRMSKNLRHLQEALD